jgi:tetratricopeptide (TPR) repeat protein
MRNALPPAIALIIAILSIPAPAAESATSADALISRGEAQLAEQDIDGAIATLTRAVAAAPDSAQAHTRLGGAYLLGQRYTDAIEQFQQAIGIDAGSAGAFIGLGMAYLHGGQSGPAKAAFTEAKRLAPDKAADLDKVINGIDEGSSAPPPAH